MCLTGIEYGSFGTISAFDVCGAGERIAGVLSHCVPDEDSGNAGVPDPPSRLGLFAMESEDAFSLFDELVDSDELLASYTAWGSDLIAQAAQALAATASRAHPGASSLQEDSVISILTGTHAPSDTVIITLHLELFSASGEASAPGFVYLLADPKSFGSVLPERVV